MGWRVARDPIDRFHAGRTRCQCAPRLEAQVAFSEMRILFADIGRVADDDVESLICQRSKPVAGKQMYTGCNTESRSISVGDRQS